MSKYLKKEYLLLLFLFVNATAEYVRLMSISKMVFYVVMSLGLLLSILNFNSIKKGLRSAPYLGMWTLLYITYLLTVGSAYGTFENWIFVLAKSSVFFILMLGIDTNFIFYLRKMAKPLGWVLITLLLVGFNQVYDYAGGRSFGYVNRNAGTAIAVIAFACFLFKNGKYLKKELFALAFCLLCILISGSRNSLVMTIFMVLMRYGVSTKLIIVGIVGMVVVVFVIPEIGFEAESINRLIGTFNGTVSLDREAEREAAWWMISQHPWDGNGFNFQNYGYALSLTEFGSHNGYIDTIEQMGWLFGGCWLVVLVIAVWSVRKMITSDDMDVKRFFAIMISVLFAANQEGYMQGVNQFVTNMLYVSLVILTEYKFRRQERFK